MPDRETLLRYVAEATRVRVTFTSGVLHHESGRFHPRSTSVEPLR